MPSCPFCHATFKIHPDEETFTQKITFTYGDQVFHPPLPLHCPDCRQQLRTCHRNERFLSKGVSGFSGKDIVSLYAREPLWGEPYVVYSQEEWHGDGWDPLDYGRDFDQSRPFFEQFAELHKAVPRLGLITVGNENSGFTTGTGYCKNCYLINSSEYCEDCYYGKLFQSSKDSVDCHYLYDSQLCYECFSCYNCYGCQYVSFSQNCNDCLFSSNLKSCKNCCLCTNLSHKEYHFMNEPLSKEEYEKRLTEFRGQFTRTEQMKTALAQQVSGMIRKYANVVNAEGCTGDYIENSSNCVDCYDMTDSQDCRYVCVGVNTKDCYDCSNMYLKPELCYQTLGTIEAYNVAYCLYVFYSQRMLYCDTCYYCSDCFGCIGLTRKQYCIFNKQYTKEEYEMLVPMIIEHMRKSGEWGQFFPLALSPFGYNESLANEYFPLSKEQALAKGFQWRERDIRDFRPQTATLPETMGEAPDSLTQEIFACRDCTRNYRIIPQELAFYRTHHLPLPRRCPDCRYDARMKLRNSRHLWQRQCDRCHKDIMSTYAPERPAVRGSEEPSGSRREKVYCDSCYLSSIS